MQRPSAVYSHDLSTRSVALFQGAILSIHKGEFDPDASRRCYFPLVGQFHNKSRGVCRYVKKASFLHIAGKQ